MLETKKDPSQTISKEVFPYKDFDIVEAPRQIYSVEPRDYFEACKEKGVVYKINRRSLFRSEASYIDYALMEQLDEDDFLFRIVKSAGYEDGTYSIDFMTERYNYALMNLSFEGTKKLEQTVLRFIKTVFDANTAVKNLKFSGADSSYSKEDVEEGRSYLLGSLPEEVRLKDVEEADAYDIKQMLSRAGIKGAKMSTATNRHGRKRDRVFSKRLAKLFEQYSLPYIVEPDKYISEVYIRRVD